MISMDREEWQGWKPFISRNLIRSHTTIIIILWKSTLARPNSEILWISSSTILNFLLMMVQIFQD